MSSESDSDFEDGDDSAPPRIDLDYDEVMEDGVFPKIDWEIYQELQARKKGPVLSDDEEYSDEEDEVPEPFDLEAFLEDYNPYDIRNESELEEFQNRVRYVQTLGIYGGGRHPDSNEREGDGRAIYANGDEYQGTYHEGLKHGSGTYWFRSGGVSDEDQLIQTEIENSPPSIQRLVETTHFVEAAKKLKLRLSKRGETVSLLRIRFVIEYGPHPFYIGDYLADERHGNGIMKYFNGSFYKGEWENGKRHGNGEIVYPEGDTYRGQWKEGRKHGKGTYQFKKLGVSYTGDWVAGQMVRGVWKMSDGTIYDGEFEGNMPSGQGLFRYREKVGIRGHFSDLEWQPTFRFVNLE